MLAVGLSGCATVQQLLARVPGGSPGAASSGVSSSSGSTASGGAKGTPLAEPGELSGEADRPSYCGKRNHGRRRPSELKEDFDDPLKRTTERFIIGLHEGLCAKDEDPADRSTLEGMRVEVMRDLGLSEADLSDVGALLDVDLGKGGYPSLRFNEGAPAEAPYEMQIAQLARVSHDFYAVRWRADMYGEALTEVARSWWLMTCLNEVLNTTNPAAGAVAYAGCGEDLRRLDRVKLWNELAAAQPGFRLAAKLDVLHAERTARALEAKLAKKPALAKRALELPKKTFETWRKLEAANAKVFAAAREAELKWIALDKDDDPSTEACDAALAGPFAQLARTAKANHGNAELDLGKSELSYVIGVGMRACLATRKDEGARAAAIGGDLAKASWKRGPRTALIEVLIKSYEDKDDPLPRIESTFTEYAGIFEQGPSRVGVVKAVKQLGERAEVHSIASRSTTTSA
jgi:hypothetical protein